ncbi:DMT family transporter [Oceanobacter antarcticus]|jgi:drug/metabolite transporter (DMT)-like permease|uniref:DMT family transporter n=1 Tax=Oceanobacter antarcticus TaxID=3133425 RepID=A0ABW8NMN6_9GAMM|tara:strand:- start:12120 stop:13043 length:924 start_codon:yes stop_codon:yes gene_type:complete
MLVIVAYLLVILIWSTTPLALQASQEGIGFFMAAMLRMTVSAMLSLPLVWIMGQRLERSRQAINSYVGGTIGIYGAMMAVYWGAHYIPSGLISVLYGLSPMLSGAIAWVWLKERELTPARVFALLVALAGLGLVVAARLDLDEQSWRGIVGTLVSVFCFALSAVWVKRSNAGLHPMVQTSGSLLLSSVLYVLSIPFFGLVWPDPWPTRGLLSLGYLTVFGSLLGFVLYFLVLRHYSAARVTMITLIAPVLAVLWGHLLNDETLQLATLQGAGLLLLALALYQWPQRLDRLLHHGLLAPQRWRARKKA